MAIQDPTRPTLPVGAKITASTGEVFTVESLLGAGGQGAVYKVRGQDGSILALKWYHADSYLKKIDAKNFYQNLKSNVEQGIPAQSSGATAAQFIWPLKLALPSNGSFGYLMNLFPQGHESLSRIILGYKVDRDGSRIPIRWKSYQCLLTAALNIVRAFEILHSQGLSYQDINEGGVSINVNTGAVFICDCDNVSPDQTNLGIRGVMNYMAPEVLRGEKLPDRHTDEYSLAIILFRLFLYNHPMEGRWSVQMRGDERISRRTADERIYGYEPHYCLDLRDPVNRPAPKHADVQKRCLHFPRVLMDVFHQVFTLGAKDPNERLTATEWRRVLVQVRDSLVMTDGAEKFFFTPVQPDLPKEARLLCYPGGRQALCMPGKVLYACHYDAYTADFSTPMGRIVDAGKRGLLGWHNVRGGEIVGAFKGRPHTFGQGDVVPLIPGLTLTIDDTVIQVK